VMEIPVTVGLIGLALAPLLAAVGAAGALLTDCTLEIVREPEPAPAAKPEPASEPASEPGPEVPVTDGPHRTHLA